MRVETCDEESVVFGCGGVVNDGITVMSKTLANPMK